MGKKNTEPPTPVSWPLPTCPLHHGAVICLHTIPHQLQVLWVLCMTTAIGVHCGAGPLDQQRECFAPLSTSNWSLMFSEAQKSTAPRRLLHTPELPSCWPTGRNRRLLLLHLATWKHALNNQVHAWSTAIWESAADIQKETVLVSDECMASEGKVTGAWNGPWLIQCPAIHSEV